MREECQRRMNEPSFPFFYGVFCEVFPGATHCGTGRARMHLFLICLYFVRRWRWWDTVNSKSGAIFVLSSRTLRMSTETSIPGRRIQGIGNSCLEGRLTVAKNRK